MMWNGGTIVYFVLSFIVSCIPAFAGSYAKAHSYFYLGLFLQFLSFVCLALSLFLYVSFQLVRRGTPFLLQFLGRINRVLAPVATRIASTKFIGPAVAVVIRLNFFIWFMVLLMSDQIIRIFLGRLVGRHPSKRNYSIVNSVDPTFELFDKTLDEAEKNDRPVVSEHSKALLMQRPEEMFPEYSRSKAYTLAVASKLVYEEVNVIKHELEKDGFNVHRSFLPMAYRNICAFIAEKDDDIYLVFRGTNPLNIQNFVTDFNISMTAVRSFRGVSMGKVHKGFWEAMGDPTCYGPSGNPISTTGRSNTTLQVELNAASLYRTIVSTIQAAVDIIKFTAMHLFHHISDPIDSSWLGHDRDVRFQSMYAQAEQWILTLIPQEDIGSVSSDISIDARNQRSHARSSKRKRLYIAGHSLGGALATIFLAKMQQSESPLLQNFCGLYTFGQPKIGNADFTRAFTPHVARKIFHHAYNNDIVTRVPSWFEYDTPPGTLVFIDSSYNITLYPPNPRTHEPVPIRPISFLHLSGLLNANVIRRLPQESLLRVIFRIVFPFFINDHFPTEYCNSLRKGSVRWMIPGQDGLRGGYSELEGDEERGLGMAIGKSPVITKRQHVAHLNSTCYT